ncbi:MAG: cell surface protein [Deltaproteobacteria bacterium]|nr:cell surface protein [Deltaproteobacteria bacterium]
MSSLSSASHAAIPLSIFFFVLFVGACAGQAPSFNDGGVDEVLDERFAVEVVEVFYGEGAGFGQEDFPDVVLGPPVGAGDGQGSIDVLSLGIGGSITLRMGKDIVDDEGADFIVFENAFYYGQAIFSEAGRVEVSDDGDEFFAFSCAPQDPAPNGCAGFAPVSTSNADDILQEDEAEEKGGDRFDLADVGIDRARFVRITDVGGAGGADGSAGFDLDAIGVLHFD